MRERTLFMRQREHNARLVGFCQRAQQVGFIGIAHHEETGEVVLIVLDMVFKHLQSIEPGSLSMTNGCPPLFLSLSYHLGTACRIFCLHILQCGMLGEELTALHQRHRMGMHLGDGVPIVVRQTTDAMRDMQLMLSYNGGA